MIENIQKLLDSDKSLTPLLKKILKTAITALGALANRVAKNSKNSSIPPSQDPNREKTKTKKSKGKKRRPGGQKGHKGTTLKQVENPTKLKR